MKHLPAIFDSVIWTAAAAWFAAETVWKMAAFYLAEIRNGTAGPCPECGRPMPGARKGMADGPGM